MDQKEEKAVVSEFLKKVFSTTSLRAKKKIVIEKIEKTKKQGRVRE